MGLGGQYDLDEEGCPAQTGKDTFHSSAGKREIDQDD